MTNAFRFKYSSIIGFLLEDKQLEETFKITVILKGNTVITFLVNSKVEALKILRKFDYNRNALIFKKKWLVIDADG